MSSYRPKTYKKNDLTKKVGRYERHDQYYHKAKAQGFAARSVFKLEEIDKDFRLLSPNDYVLDLGCAPGSWLQYVEKVISKGKGLAVGIDLLPVKAALGPKVRVIQGDIYEASIEDLLPASHNGEQPRFDVVLSDMAPNMSGIRSADQAKSLDLCERALALAEEMLRPGGHFCIKILEGGGMKDFLLQCRKMFEEVKVRRPKGVREGSIETYVTGLRKK